jgi:hypothetical protein
MKSGVLSFLCILPFFASGQSILEPHNPAPRVGDQIEMSVYFKKKDLADLERKESKSDSENTLLQTNRIAIGTLRLTQVPTDTGEYIVGPISLTFNGQVYTTDKLMLRVSPALPAQEADGIWIRSLTHGGHNYLIIEQRIANQWKKQDDGTAITLSTEEVAFAEFDREKFESKGLEIISSSSSTNTHEVDKRAGFGAGTSAYKISIFKFERTPIFKGHLQIDKKFFSNLPKNIQLPATIIR